MLFFIGASIARDFENKQQESIDFVARLIDYRKRGYLLIHASDKTYASLIKTLQNMSREHEARILDSIQKNSRQIKIILKDLKRMVYVSNLVDERIALRGNFLFMSANSINCRETMHPPILLAENLTDCRLYATAIAKNFTAGLPITLRNLKIYENYRSGGGNSTDQTYKHIKTEDRYLCFCIVDSDRKFPGEAIGDTAKRVTNVDKRSKSAFCEHMIIDAYSAENLLPICELERQFKKDKNSQQLAEFSKLIKLRSRPSWRYLALKKGITSTELRSQNAHSKFWKREIELLEIDTQCCNNVNCKCKLIPSLNEKTLAQAVKTTNTDWHENVNSEVNEHLRQEYVRISHEVRSWFCVGNPIRS